jgi:fibronectin-binding autotransporter adhesin
MTMKTKFKIRGFAGKIQLGVAAVLALFAVRSAQAGSDFWAGLPGVTPDTNWSDVANWTGAQQTYYNQVEFTGVGGSANNNFSVNNVLDSTLGVAQMPIWELDYVPTNVNYTTLIDPGLTMELGAGQGHLMVGTDINSPGNPAPAGAVETITITGSGATLEVGGSVNVGQGSSTDADGHNVTLDLSGLDTFIQDASSYGGNSGANWIYVAGPSTVYSATGPIRANGTLNLAKTNYINLNQDFQICNQANSNSLPCAVYLGQVNDIGIGGNLIVGGTGTTAQGAWIKFNPAFLGGAGAPVASFTSASGGRIANFWIGNENGGPQISGNALCDFSGGNVNMSVNSMQLGVGGNAGANAEGMLTLDNGAVNVNNATIGNQEVSAGGTGVGIVNLNTNTTYGANGSLVVNNTLTLGAVSGTVTAGTAGTINIKGGALIANTITNGGGTAAINVTNGSVTLSGTAGASSAPISNLAMVNSTLSVAVIPSTTEVVVSSLTTGGTTNIINITSVPSSPTYPVQVSIIKYSGTIGGTGYNFGVGTLPALCVGYLSNNTTHGSIDLVLTAGPSSDTWKGSVNGNWDTMTANWVVGSTPATYANGAFVQFLDGANTGTVNLTTTLSPGGITISNNALSYTFNGSGALTGSSELLKQGTGTLILDNSGANTLSGGVIISNGVLQVGNNDANGSLPAGTITDNGNLAFAQNGTVANNNVIAGTGSVTYEGSGELQLAGANTFSGQVLVSNNSTLQLGNSSALGLGSSNLIISSGSTLDANGNASGKPIVVSGTGVGGNGAITDTGGAVYGLANSVTLAGDTTFTFPNRWDLDGAVTLGTGGNAYNLTLNPASGVYFQWQNVSVDPALANINLEGGSFGIVGSTTFGNPSGVLTIAPSATLVFYGAPNFMNKGVDFQDGYIENNGGNNIMAGAMTLESGYCTFDINSGSLTVSNILSGPGVFYIQGGTGTVVIGGNSPSYTGGVLLYDGQLTLNGTIGSGGITAESGTTLTGSGNSEGLVSVAGTFLPGGASTAGTFTASGLTLGGGAALTMDLAPTTTVGSGVNDEIVVNGDLTVNGNNITINPLSGTLASGTYTLFTYTGNLNGSFGTASTISSSRYTFTISTSTPHQVNLIVTGTPNLLKWNNGGNNGQWDVQSSYNWTNLTAHDEDQFFSGDVAILDNSITTAANPTTTLNIGSGIVVLPSIVTNNSSTNYTISGQGTISGGGSFVKMGTSTLTIGTSNSFTGNFTIAGGAVQMNGQITASSSPVGAANGTLYITNGSTLYVNLQGGYPAGTSGFGPKPIVVSGAGANGLGAIQNIGNPIYDDSSTLGLGYNITMAGNTTIGGTARLDWGYPGYGMTLSTGGSNYNLTVIENQYFRWADFSIDTNLGNIDVYNSTANNYTWELDGMGGGLGNPTNILTVHSNVEMQITHGTEGYPAADDSGYAKVIHILPTASFDFQPGGGAGDYRLASSFILESNVTFTFYSGNGGNNTGTVVNGPITFNGLVHIEIGNSLITFSNVVSGIGGFYMDNYGGNPPLCFAAANTYTGITDIRSSMDLFLIGNGSISDSTPISLASSAVLAVTNRVDGKLTLTSGQTLEGSGNVVGNLVAGSGSTVAPGTTSTGTTIGTLSVSGNATLGGNTVFKLNGGTSDEIAVGGSVTYGGTLTLTNISASPLAAGTFQVFSAGSYSGAFSSISPASPGAGLAWNTNNLSVNGTLSIVTTTGPKITGITINGATLNISATNGPANTPYVLLESTNLLVPVSHWTSILTNSFNSGGGFTLSTNIVNAHNNAEFYILQVQ